MSEVSILQLNYQFHRVGKIITSYRIQYMEDRTYPVDLKSIYHDDAFGHYWTWMDDALEEVDPMTEEAQKQLLWDRPSRWQVEIAQAGLDGHVAETDLEEKVYRVTHDLFEILSYNIIGNSYSAGHSGGLEWEIESIGFDEFITDCNYPKTYHTSSLADIINLANERHKHHPKNDDDAGHMLFLYEWDGELDQYTKEYDSWWSYLGPITDAHLATLSREIIRTSTDTGKPTKCTSSKQLRDVVRDLLNVIRLWGNRLAQADHHAKGEFFNPNSDKWKEYVPDMVINAYDLAMSVLKSKPIESVVEKVEEKVEEPSHD